MVDSPPIITGKRLDFLLKFLSMESVVHGTPRISWDPTSVDPDPWVVRDSGVPIVLNMRLGWHVFHLLKNHVSCHQWLKKRTGNHTRLYFESGTIVIREFHMDQMNPH